MDENPVQPQGYDAQPPQEPPVAPEPIQPVVEPVVAPAPAEPVIDAPAPEPVAIPEPIVETPAPVIAEQPAVAPVEPVVVAPAPEPQPVAFAEPQPIAPVEPATAPEPILPPTPEPVVAAPTPSEQPILGSVAPPVTSYTPQKPKQGLIIGIIVAVVVVVLGLIVALVVIPSLTSKTLSCTISKTNPGQGVESVDGKIEVKFRGDTAQSIDFEIAYVFDSADTAKSFYDVNKDAIVEAYDAVKEENSDSSVEMKITGPDLDGNKIIVKISADRSMLNKVLTAGGLNSNEKAGLEDLKATLEDDGYTCSN